MSNLEEINKEIDQVIVQLLEHIQEYESLTLDAEISMRSGYNMLSKARYLKGSNYATQSSFPGPDSDEEFQASVTVLNSKASDHNVTEGHRNLVSKYTDQKIEAQELIRQFGGILAPQPMKSAYSSFRSTLEKTIERLNTATAIELAQSRLSKLRGMKVLIVQRGDLAQQLHTGTSKESEE